MLVLLIPVSMDTAMLVACADIIMLGVQLQEEQESQSFQTAITPAQSKENF